MDCLCHGGKAPRGASHWCDVPSIAHELTMIMEAARDGTQYFTDETHKQEVREINELRAGIIAQLPAFLERMTRTHGLLTRRRV